LHLYCVCGVAVAFIPAVVAVIILMSSLLLLLLASLSCVPHCSCLPVAVVAAIAGAPLVSDVLSVAGLPAIAGILGVVGLMLSFSSLLVIAFLPS
jgi:hypothetical protein